MGLSRRDFLWLGLAGTSVMISGCVSGQSQASARPGPLWPQSNPRPSTAAADLIGPTASTPPKALTPPVAAATATSQGGLSIIPRKSWTNTSPILTKIHAMGGVKKITVHHEGWTPVWFADTDSTAKRMESIRKSHLQRLGAGDIGYHYVIDRAGRVWQGRDVRYQGAHVREHNPNNLGVMVLGNFDVQRPTDAQMVSLRATVATLMKQHRVPLKLVYTHQELNPTECPGKALQSNMISLRRSGLA